MSRCEKWKQGKLKHLAVIRNGQDYKNVVSESGSYPVYGSGGVFAKATDFLYDGKSVLFGRKGTIDKPRLAAGRFWTVDTMFYSEVDSQACPEFVYYVATTIPYSLYSTSTALPSMTQDDLKNHAVLIPSLLEQRQIAGYLNRETAKIDKLIIKQQKLIKLLQEKRQAVISQAVTKGLNPNVKMKDSRVEWLGEAPEHWPAIKLGFVYQMRSGDAITTENIEVEGTFPVYGGNGLRGYSEKYTHNGDFLLMGRQGALCGNIHKVSGKFWASEHAVVLNPLMSCVPSYMANLLRHMNLGQYSVSAAQPGLSVDVISKLRIPFPPIEEQMTIAGYLDEQESSVRNLVEKSITSISLLQEHRQALITAAVTGKIDVRGLVTDEEVAALDADPVLETTEEDFESEVAEADYITEEE